MQNSTSRASGRSPHLQGSNVAARQRRSGPARRNEYIFRDCFGSPTRTACRGFERRWQQRSRTLREGERRTASSSLLHDRMSGTCSFIALRSASTCCAFIIAEPDGPWDRRARRLGQPGQSGWFSQVTVGAKLMKLLLAPTFVALMLDNPDYMAGGSRTTHVVNAARRRGLAPQPHSRPLPAQGTLVLSCRFRRECAAGSTGEHDERNLLRGLLLCAGATRPVTEPAPPFRTTAPGYRGSFLVIRGRYAQDAPITVRRML